MKSKGFPSAVATAAAGGAVNPAAAPASPLLAAVQTACVAGSLSVIFAPLPALLSGTLPPEALGASVLDGFVGISLARALGDTLGERLR
jgi:hypothetical protein